MPQKLRRYHLKAKEAETLVSSALERIRIDVKKLLGPNLNMEVVETDHIEIYLVRGRPVLAKVAGDMFPTLLFSEFEASAPKVVVDMGAIPHVCNGADVMAPGIVRFQGEFQKGDLVVVVDVSHKKAIALGEAIYDSENSKKTRQGVIVRNLHYAGDTVWNAMKALEIK